ncbi:hypothetical protein PENSUB_13126 [Penicillium subrubescens]|uniref:Ketoreductase (KR) domain-containing protein n=1 Tax=Penicillium subrubescens TaxID=1316194 RepID=A0A1Q5SSH8_9EURO|nr:hypothetical protein PENSUB_13126 [Penicillium subrubescens]
MAVLVPAQIRRRIYARYPRGGSAGILGIEKINISELVPFHDDPSRLFYILKQVSTLQLDQSIRRPSLKQVWSAPRSIEAIQWAQKPAQHVNGIITFHSDDRVPVTPGLANPLALDGDATYLLAGGTGGRGANLARFLARKGAKNLAIISRSGSSTASAESVFQDLTAKGV